MISESSYYKDELLRMAQRMEKRLLQKQWHEPALVCFEKDIFWAFYIIRKLFEKKTVLTNNVRKLEIPLRTYPYKKSKKINIINLNRIDELYDLDKSSI